MEAGRVTSIIGPNGAGKTTLFDVISGFERPDSGVWYHRGRTLAGTPPATWRGTAWSGRSSTRASSPAERPREHHAGGPPQTGERLASALMPAAWRREEREIEERAMTCSSGSACPRSQELPAGRLSGGQRKLLELTRAVMTEPTLLLLDEPMAGVNPVLREKLLGHMAILREEGMTVVLIEHDMDAVARISDWVVCLADGRSSPRVGRRGAGRPRRDRCLSGAGARGRSRRAPKAARHGRGRFRGSRSRRGLSAGDRHPERLLAFRGSRRSGRNLARTERASRRFSRRSSGRQSGAPARSCSKEPDHPCAPAWLAEPRHRLRAATRERDRHAERRGESAARPLSRAAPLGQATRCDAGGVPGARGLWRHRADDLPGGERRSSRSRARS